LKKILQLSNQVIPKVEVFKLNNGTKIHLSTNLIHLIDLLQKEGKQFHMIALEKEVECFNKIFTSIKTASINLTLSTFNKDMIKDCERIVLLEEN
jgi:hypothetical protein